MAENTCVPSVPLAYENDSSAQNPSSLTSLPNDSFVLGDKITTMTGLSKQTTTNNNQIPTPASQSPPSSPPLPPVFRNPTLSMENLTIEPSSKRLRGRPRGSKNKPKLPTIIENPGSFMKPVVIKIPLGNDVIESLTYFARIYNVNLIVLSAVGNVSSVVICHPLIPNGPTLPFSGLYKIISLTGTHINVDVSGSSTANNGPTNLKSFTINFAKTPDAVYGGIVAGKLMAASIVSVTCAMFMIPKYERIPHINGSVQVEQGGEGAMDHLHSSDSLGMVANNNNVVFSNMPAYVGVAGESSTLLNFQLPVYPPITAMQWNNFANPNGY